LDASGLIRATGAPLGDCFLWNIFEIFLEKSSKILLYYFVKVCVKFFPKICHFQSFPSPFTSLFIA
jgi:hypothetical protein